MQRHIEILLADGTTRLKAAITAQSADRLALNEGKEVLVLLKAPWVNITADAEKQKPLITSYAVPSATLNAVKSSVKY